MSLTLWHPIMLPCGFVCLFGAYLMIRMPPRRLAEIIAVAIDGKPYWQPPILWGKTYDQKIVRVHGMLYQLIATLLLFGIAFVVLAWVPYDTVTGR